MEFSTSQKARFGEAADVVAIRLQAVPEENSQPHRVACKHPQHPLGSTKGAAKMAPHDEDDNFPLYPEASHNSHRYPTAESLAVVPFEAAPASALSVVRTRHQLKRAVEDAKLALIALRQIEHREKAERLPLLIDALVAAAIEHQLPLPETQQIDIYRQRAASGAFDNRAALAADEIEDALETFETALASLRVASKLDEPLPASWSNLPTLKLARNLTRLGHTMLRGRIPALNL
jgi:hypothetical protein